MLKLLLGLVIEILIGVLLAGLILALTIPLLNRSDLAGTGDLASRVVITTVLAVTIAVALFRRGSALRRFLNR